MTELHQNLIDGEWVGGDGADNINLSNLSDVVGTYARASADDAQRDVLRDDLRAGGFAL